MAIPVYLQQFKAAGIYRVVFDKSTVAGVDSEILRLIVGYSEKGPFNIPTYIKSVTDFKAIYGDISKKLEKRGIFFHRLAIQALSAGPILCLNLKKFDGETVDGATICSDFNTNFEAIETVTLNVEDIYDTTRFWELSAEKLIDLKSTSGAVMNQYINMCTTNTSATSATYFIRKASGTKVSGYNITVNDWYSSGTDEMPEYLEPYKNRLMSDFFAEVYVFNGKFSAGQVLASSTLKNYFEVMMDETTGKPKTDEDGEIMLKLRSYVLNAYGNPVDTLDTLYNDETSGALGHYIGALIPNFTNKQGQYASLDIVFNSDNDTHNMMMAFNTDMLELDGTASIDLSGKASILTKTQSTDESDLILTNLYEGTATSRLLGNDNAPVVTDIISFSNSVVTLGADGKYTAAVGFTRGSKKVTGTLYVAEVNAESETLSGSGSSYTSPFVRIRQVGSADDFIDIHCKDLNALKATAIKLGVTFEDDDVEKPNGGTYYGDANPFITSEGAFDDNGPEKIITSITRIERVSATDKKYANCNQNEAYEDSDNNLSVSIEDVDVVTTSTYPGKSESDSVYGSSVSFLPLSDYQAAIYEGEYILYSEKKSLYAVLQAGDCLLANDGTVDGDGDGYADDKDGFFDNVFVQKTDYRELTFTIDNETITKSYYVISLSGEALQWSPSGSENDENEETTESEVNYPFIIRVDSALNQEIGEMVPQYFKGYTYKHDKPEGTDMLSKLNWQDFILSALTEYKGLRTALLNKADLDYRYVIDTFESYVDAECKNVLSLLCKEKQSAFAILNFPSVKTFIKCPYTSFTNAKGVFDVEYVVAGYNKKKAAGRRFSLPTDVNGASFCAFYTPLKFSDGYVDTIVPAAGLVSNLFIEKYNSRQPYYIIAGPNYGRITAANLVGPDYSYSQDELQLIEPFGVNCMIYRPNFGTFINANQTAKQTPVSALSKVNVRELVIYLQDEIEKVLQAYQWEFNNQTTRNAILDKANSICARVAANGGIQAYLNVMDESNNTPEIIDNEMAVLSTHIEPGHGCGKMVQELTLYRTGELSSLISD